MTHYDHDAPIRTVDDCLELLRQERAAAAWLKENAPDSNWEDGRDIEGVYARIIYEIERRCA